MERCFFGGHPASADPPCCEEQAKALTRCAACAALGKETPATRRVRDFQGVERSVCDACGERVEAAREIASKRRRDH